MTNNEFLHLLRVEVYGTNKISVFKWLFHFWYNSFIDLEHSFLFKLRLMQKLGNSKFRFVRLLSAIMRKRILTRYGCCVHPRSKIGCGFHVPHPTGIVIGCDVVIGDNCTVYQNVTLGSKVDAGHDIGCGFHVPHPTGIVIGCDVVIGDNCTVYQNVTLGSKVDAGHDVTPQPILGNKVMIYANSLVLGGVQIKNGTIIGANSLVLNDTVENGVYIGTPAIQLR